jgi:beta-1,2-mannobiose phosphorylase / 1,2-beta-oligomannan phosphorylase
MRRFQGNPILQPIASNSWESVRVFNAAAIKAGKQIHILYRAMGNDGISRFGYAASSDGYVIDERLQIPVFEPNNNAENYGCEDPRLTLFNDRVLLAYTALTEFDHEQLYQISLTSISINDFLDKRWKWGERIYPFNGVRNKDAVVFPKKIDGKYVMFHRVEPDMCLAYSDDLRRWYDIRAMMRPRTKSWDSWKIGAAGPPIELNEGWLVIYHGVSFEKVYSLGVLILDRDNPVTIRYRSETPILTPAADYERFGKVPNVVFSCGNVLLNDEVLVYYGGADSVVCVATYELNELMPKK